MPRRYFTTPPKGILNTLVFAWELVMSGSKAERQGHQLIIYPDGMPR